MGQLDSVLLTLPLYNTGQTQVTPVNPNASQARQTTATLLEPPDSQVFFRGTVRLRYNDDQGLPQTVCAFSAKERSVSEPLVVLKMKQRDRRLKIDFPIRQIQLHPRC